MLLLWAVLHFAGADFFLPLNYLKDANIFLARAKSLIEGGWVWNNPRLGMPFGANWMDFPMNVTVDSGVMWALSRFTSSAPLIVNLDWMIGLAATAGLAAYAFLRLGFGSMLAFACGVIFALQPYSWFQGTKHLHCLSCAVPLVAASSIEVIRGRWSGFRKVPVYAWIGCVIAGLSYAYIAFFGCVVLACAGVVGWIARRDRTAVVIGLALAACTGGVAVADLSPSLIYEARNGENAAMLFKSPVEGEIYGLKIRYLITPSPDHPLQPMRRLEQRLAATRYPPFENENEYTRLGTVGSIGLLCLIGLLLGALVNPRIAERAGSSVLGPCAALTLACILTASTGGLYVFFNTLVSPEIRAGARIFPFIGFFCVAAAGAVAGPFLRRLTRVRRAAVLGIVTVLAIFDQAVPSAAYDHKDSVYGHDREFVQEVEKLLPAESSVFELPFVEFPNDNHPGESFVNDSLRPYLHSAGHRWSAGAVSGTVPAEWSRLIAGLPPAEMLNALVHQDFAGLWLDSAGYGVKESLETAITSEAGTVPVRDSSGRFVFYGLRSYAARMHAMELAMDPPQLRARNPVQAVFERGFFFKESGTDGAFHWSLRRGRVTLVNPLPLPRRLKISMRIGTADEKSHETRISWPGGAGTLRAPGAFERLIEVPALGRDPLNFSCDCPGVRTETRTVYFFVSNFEARDQEAAP
jgi:phosphoglycerol transferase